MSTLRIDILPKNAQKEIQDFYEFLVSKYVHNKKKNEPSWQKDLLSVGTWKMNENE